MSKSNDEIYDIVVGIDKKLDMHLAVHAEREAKRQFGWKVWAAIVGGATALPVSVISLFVR